MKSTSSIIFNESLQIGSADYGKCFTVDKKQPESLADYVRRVRIHEKDLSLSEVERNAHAAGHEIAGSYVSRIENDLIANVSPEKLRALAAGLKVPEDEVFAIARGKSTANGELSFDESRILDYYRALPSERKADTMAFVELMYHMHAGDSSNQAVGSRPIFKAIAGIPKSLKAKKSSKRKKQGKSS